MTQFNKYRSIYSHEELMAKLRRLKHVALDMDGTIYMGATLFPYTKPFLAGVKDMGLRYSFLTNNPSSSIADYLAKLARLGVADAARRGGAVLSREYRHQHDLRARLLFEYLAHDGLESIRYLFGRFIVVRADHQRDAMRPVAVHLAVFNAPQYVLRRIAGAAKVQKAEFLFHLVPHLAPGTVPEFEHSLCIRLFDGSQIGGIAPSFPTMRYGIANKHKIIFLRSGCNFL